MFDLSMLQSIFSLSFLGFNLLDLVILIVVGFYAYEGYQLGFILAFLDFLSFVFSFVAAILWYSLVANILVKVFNMPIGFANAGSFFLLALLVEIVLNILLRELVYKRFIPLPGENARFDAFRKIDKGLGIIPGSVSALVFISFILTLVVALPSSTIFKDLIDNSRFGSTLVTSTSAFEGQVNNIFGGAFHETISFLTVEPKSNEIVTLHFTVPNGVIDKASETQMFNMVNKERTSRGIPALVSDPKLVDLARTYASDMFAHGYFSHYNLQGQSPFDRMQAAGIDYNAAGENLALAPNTNLAMQGLMNSPGHKANILSTNYGRVGIGVVDGGIYGKMFVQEFTN